MFPLNDKIENVIKNYKAILNGQYDKLLQPKNLTKEKFADTLLNFSDVVNIITFGNLNDVSKAITVESVRKKLNNPSGEKPQMNTFQRSAFSQLIRVEPDQKVYFPKSKFSNFFDKTFDEEIEYYHYLKSSALKRPDLNNTRLVSAKFTKSTKGAAITEYLMSTTNGTQFDTLKLAVIFEYCDNTCDSAAINYLFIPNGINEDTFINENKIIIGDDETQEEYTIINSSENPASKQIDRVLEYLNENENTEGQDFEDFQNFFSGAFKLTGLTSFHDEVRWDFVKENWPKFVKNFQIKGNKYMGAWEKLAKIENERFFLLNFSKKKKKLSEAKTKNLANTETLEKEVKELEGNMTKFAIKLKTVLNDKTTTQQYNLLENDNEFMEWYKNDYTRAEQTAEGSYELEKLKVNNEDKRILAHLKVASNQVLDEIDFLPLSEKLRAPTDSSISQDLLDLKKKIDFGNDYTKCSGQTTNKEVKACILDYIDILKKENFLKNQEPKFPDAVSTPKNNPVTPNDFQFLNPVIKPKKEPKHYESDDSDDSWSSDSDLDEEENDGAKVKYDTDDLSKSDSDSDEEEKKETARKEILKVEEKKTDSTDKTATSKSFQEKVKEKYIFNTSSLRALKNVPMWSMDSLLKLPDKVPVTPTWSRPYI